MNLNFAKNNFRPKAQPVENGVFSKLGRGNWATQAENAAECLQWLREPFEILPFSVVPEQFRNDGGSKSIKAFTGDPVKDAHVEVCSATSLPLKNESIDLFITDPPFGDLLQYSELSDFFYVWLRLVSEGQVSGPCSEAKYTPKALEAVENKARHPDDPAAFYQRVLTESWREAYRALKPGGLLAFHVSPQRGRAVGWCLGESI